MQGYVREGGVLGVIAKEEREAGERGVEAKEVGKREREGRERIGFEVSHERGKSVGMGEEEEGR